MHQHRCSSMANMHRWICNVTLVTAKPGLEKFPKNPFVLHVMSAGMPSSKRLPNSSLILITATTSPNLAETVTSSMNLRFWHVINVTNLVIKLLSTSSEKVAKKPPSHFSFLIAAGQTAFFISSVNKKNKCDKSTPEMNQWSSLQFWTEPLVFILIHFFLTSANTFPFRRKSKNSSFLFVLIKNSRLIF